MFKLVDRTSLANRMAMYERRSMWQAKAALVAQPLLFLLVGIFDPGGAGQIIRAALEMLVR